MADNPNGRRVCEIDWYDHRNELKPGMVFNSCWGIVKLDHRKPGDGTDWVVADWTFSSIDSCGGWAYYESTIHPGDLTQRLPDDYAGGA